MFTVSDSNGFLEVDMYLPNPSIIGKMWYKVIF